MTLEDPAAVLQRLPMLYVWIEELDEEGLAQARKRELEAKRLAKEWEDDDEIEVTWPPIRCNAYGYKVNEEEEDEMYFSPSC